MALSKMQTVAAVSGGVFILAAGVLGYFFYDNWAQRTEAEDELAEEMDLYNKYNSDKVFPSKKSIDSVKSNAVGCAEWRKTALEFAARGDKTLPAESATVFKQRLEQQIRVLRDLPGGVSGKIAADTFLFGFDQYLGDSGVLPPQSDIPRLAIQLDTISDVVKLFSSSGVAEVKEIRRIEPPKGDEDSDEAAKPKKKGAKSVDSAEDEDANHTQHSYAVTFAARPESLVTVLNSFVSDVRFTVVSGFSFSESQENMIDKALDALMAAKNPEGAAASSGRRGRRGRRAAVQEEAPADDGEKKGNRLVVDPSLDLPLVVSLTITVHDFGRSASVAASASAENSASAGQAAAPVKEAK